eukprot:Em0024g187a
MASDLTKNEFWLKKMTARFHAMNSKKDGVLTKADFDILIENIIKFGKLNDAQAERCRKQMATLLPLFGDETFKITQEGFNDAAAKSSEGNYLVLWEIKILILLTLTPTGSFLTTSGLSTLKVSGLM